MNLNEFNSLIDLFFYQAKKQNPENSFLEWLNPKNKKKFTWSETTSSIYKLAKILKENINDGDRSLLVSENRPEWLISDIAIMLASGITVPAYTTNIENDYRYLIEDCEPTAVIVSNSSMHKKLEKIITEKEYIKTIITFDNITREESKKKYFQFESITKTVLSEKDKIKTTNQKRTSRSCTINWSNC